MPNTAPVPTPGQLTEIAHTYGTPVYVYHAERITHQYRKLEEAFAGMDIRFFYACKALTNINILRHLLGLGANLDCVSINEVRLGMKAGFTPDRILFSPNGADPEEYAAAAEEGVHVNIDSLSALDRFGRRFGGRVPVCIRINPNIMAGGNLKISTGHADSKFGIPSGQIEEITETVNRNGMRVEGLHIHTGSEIERTEVFLAGLELLFGMADRFPDLSFIDMGSGFKVPYREGDKETDVRALGRSLSEAFSAFTARTGRRLQAWMEPGKYLVSECGYLVVKATVVKPTPTRTFVGVDSGFNHLVRPMFYESHHELRNLSNPEGPLQPYTVVGNICETDTFAWDRPLPEVREGDLLAFLNAGAYGFEMSSRYNSRCRPPEVMIAGGGHRLIRRRETLDDLLEGQVVAP